MQTDIKKLMLLLKSSEKDLCPLKEIDVVTKVIRERPMQTDIKKLMLLLKSSEKDRCRLT